MSTNCYYMYFWSLFNLPISVESYSWFRFRKTFDDCCIDFLVPEMGPQRLRTLFLLLLLLGLLLL